MNENEWMLIFLCICCVRRRFYIVSELNDKVLDIKGANADSGAKIITWGRHGDAQKNELWYLGHEGCIRSALNHMTFENSGWHCYYTNTLYMNILHLCQIYSNLFISY